MTAAIPPAPRRSPRLPLIKTFAEVGESDLDEVGGKGLSLARMTAAGLPVPAGFCITCAAYRLAVGTAIEIPLPKGGGAGSLAIDTTLRERLLDHYRELGGGLVAVRSSATLEDGSTASFAGQQETILGVLGDEPLIDAVVKCWNSLHSERALVYRQRQGVADADVAMAVVVQRLVPSEVSGVLFTRDPLDATGQRMLIEAARGLGESVVSGRVQPDRYHTARETGVLLDQELHKQVDMLTAQGRRELSTEEQGQACLSTEQLVELTVLGRQVEDFYGEPRDIEWAFAEGRFWLLQARPITTADAFEREQVRREEIERLTKVAAPGGTVWSRYNLAEVLPEPTPLTWSIVQRLVSASGGFGAMYRALGFDPDPCLNDVGFFDLICGRVYVNLSREPKMYFRDFPYGHDFAKLKADPQLASYPTPAVDPAKATWRTYLRLPMIAWKMLQSSSRLTSLRKTHADRFDSEFVPSLAGSIEIFQLTSLGNCSPAQLREHLDTWIEWTLVRFAQHSLQGAMFAAACLAELERSLAAVLGDEDHAKQQARKLVSGARPAPECDLPGALERLAAGKFSREEFLKNFGHRGPKEMELSQPRWKENPNSIPTPNVGLTHAASLDDAAAVSVLRELVTGRNASLSATEFTLRETRRYLALREAGKHYLMRGYAIIREILLELDKRLGLRGDIFYLTLEELRAQVEQASQPPGPGPQPLLAARKRRRQIELTLPLPPVIFSDDLEAIGRTESTHHEGDWKGTPLSFGEYEGPALVLEEPIPPGSVAPGYVLVCPTTDPAWAPLFLHAGALVMETGGVLSHGAIVAREFGLPAVAGLPGVQRQIVSGQIVRVSGTTGVVRVIAS